MLGKATHTTSKLTISYEHKDLQLHKFLKGSQKITISGSTRRITGSSVIVNPSLNSKITAQNLYRFSPNNQYSIITARKP